MVHRKIAAKVTANKWKSAFVGLVLLVILAFVSGMIAIGSSPGLGKETAGSKAIDYINKNVLNGAATATLQGVSESNGLYLIKLSIAGRNYDSYITKDGKLLFPSAISLADEAVAATSTPQAAFDAPDSEKPNVKLFVMSFCPYGQQAEAGLGPVHALLGNKTAIEPHFVIYSGYQGGSPQYCAANGTLCSMHGIAELNEDVRQMCVYKYYGPDKFWDYAAKINSGCNSGNADSCWESVAKTVTGIDAEKIKTCQKDEEVALATAEKALNEKYGVRGSPTIFINERQYGGDRSAEGFKQAVCSGFATKPAECSQAIAAANGGQDSANTHPGDVGCGG